MLFNTALFTGLFLASEALAFPSGLAARLARRRRGLQSQPSKLVASDASTTGLDSEPPNTSWAGAQWRGGDGTFIGTTVTGTFTVPTISGSPNDQAFVWVGIDGSNTCLSGAILQTGIYLNIDGDGFPEYNAAYEWFPGDSNGFPGISFSPGDVAVLTVEAYSTTSGNATVENLTTGMRMSQYLSDTSNPLCGQTAEWIVEDPESYTNGPPTPFTNFGTVTFTDASAGSYTLDGANTFDIEQNNVVLTSTSVASDSSSVTIEYIGPN